MKTSGVSFFLCFLRCILTICIIGFGSTVFAQAPWRLYASVSDFNGAPFAPTYIAGIDIAAQSKTVLFNVPDPGTNTVPSTDFVRDLVVDSYGNISVYNGTFNPFLLRYDASTTNYTQTTFSGWSTLGNLTYGGIIQRGNFVYLGDMNTSQGPEQGILKVNLTTGEHSRFATGIEPSDINLGLDGLIYAINGAGSPTSSIFVFDPISESLVNTIGVPSGDYRSVAALEDGSIFTANLNGDIFHFDLSGSLINSLNVAGVEFSDIDINSSGEIALGTAIDGEIVLTTVDLTSYTKFQITEGSSLLNGTVFVTWAQVPEPSTSAWIAFVFVLLVAQSIRIRAINL